MIELPELIAGMKIAATKATKGQWKLCEEGEYIFANGDMVAEIRGIGALLNTQANGEFISLTNPENLLRVFKQYERMQEALEKIGNVGYPAHNWSKDSYVELIDELVTLAREASDP